MTAALRKTTEHAAPDRPETAGVAPAPEAPQGRPVTRWRRWPWLVLLLLIAAVAAFVVLERPAPEAPAMAEATPQPIVLLPIEVAEVRPQTLEAAVRISGPLSPFRQATLSAEVSAPVEDVTARIGEAVRAGDVLVRFDTSELRARLDQVEANLAAAEAQRQLARSTFERTASLAERGVAPRATLDSDRSAAEAARANVAALEAQLRDARRALERAVVAAPFDGIVAERAVSAGESVAAGAALVTLVDLSVMEIEATVPASDIAGIAAGQTATLTVEGIPDRSFEAVVDRIGPVAIAGTRAIPVYLVLPNPDGVLRGGMFATGRIVVRQVEGALALGPTAIREDAEGAYVLKIAEGRLVRQPVTLGGRWNQGEAVEITAGLAPGDIVATAPLPDLEPGRPAVVQEG